MVTLSTSIKTLPLPQKSSQNDIKTINRLLFCCLNSPMNASEYSGISVALCLADCSEETLKIACNKLGSFTVFQMHKLLTCCFVFAVLEGDDLDGIAFKSHQKENQ